MVSCPALVAVVAGMAGTFAVSAAGVAFTPAFGDALRSQAQRASNNVESTRTPRRVAEPSAAQSNFSSASGSAAANGEHLLQIGVSRDHFLHAILQ